MTRMATQPFTWADLPARSARNNLQRWGIGRIPTSTSCTSCGCAGASATDAVGEAIGDAEQAERLLRGAADAGLVVHRDGRIAGWSLTPEGRADHAARLRQDREAAGAADAVRAAYERFLAVNAAFLVLCTRWQVLPDGTPNGHADGAYDEAVIDELGQIDEAMQPVCADLAAALERCESYGPRLAAALTRVRAGDRQWFTSPAIDSYHTVWFELHEDLLQTLGLERGGDR